MACAATRGSRQPRQRELHHRDQARFDVALEQGTQIWATDQDRVDEGIAGQIGQLGFMGWRPPVVARQAAEIRQIQHFESAMGEFRPDEGFANGPLRRVRQVVAASLPQPGFRQMPRRARREHRDADQIGPHLLPRIKAQHRARPPIAVQRLANRLPDEIEALVPAFPRHQVQIDHRHGVVLDHQDEVVAGMQVLEIVQRVIRVVPEERPLGMSREAEIEQIGFAVTDHAIERNRTEAALGLVNHQIDMRGWRGRNHAGQPAPHEVVHGERLEEYRVMHVHPRRHARFFRSRIAIALLFNDNAMPRFRGIQRTKTSWVHPLPRDAMQPTATSVV